MKAESHPHPLPVLSPSGNGEERAAQIERIQARLDRLRRYAENIATEVAAVTAEMDQLHDHPSPDDTRPPISH